ncbi:MAG: S8 family peptidase [Dehalococcoidia bacterium]|nr:S8 family peptidase [Dehalococcoidia bacterium]
MVRRQVDPDVLRQAEGTPSLEERGYESLPVPDGMTQQAFLEQLRADPEIASAEPDARVYAAQTPNDPYYINQPGQQQVGYLSSVGAPGAWDHAVGREDVVVAVLDSGMDLSHPDLESQLWTNEDEVAGNGTDDDGNGCIDDVNGCRFLKVDAGSQAACGYLPGDGTPTGDVWDDNGSPDTGNHSHGTMVSGIVGAAGNNNEGIAGVGWNVRLMPVKVLGCGGPTGRDPSGHLSDVAKGIDYARRMGADVINLSLATRPDSNDNSALRDAIAAAEDEGVIIVAAAGNNGSSSDPSPGYPGRYTQYSNLVTVGASDWQSNHEWESFSAYGPSLDLAAPGSQLLTTIRSDIAPEVPYGIAQKGTSFATPFVSGMFALMISRNSAMDVSDYIDLAREAAEPGAGCAPRRQLGRCWHHQCFRRRAVHSHAGHRPRPGGLGRPARRDIGGCTHRGHELRERPIHLRRPGLAFRALD